MLRPLPLDVLLRVCSFLDTHEVLHVDSRLKAANILSEYWSPSRGLVFSSLPAGHLPMPALQYAAKELTSLTLEFCSEIPVFEDECVKLRTLHIDGCADALVDRDLTGTLVTDRLEHLSVYWSPRITSSSLCYIAESCPKLRYLNLSGALKMSDIGIESVARNCPRLEYLDLTKLKETTDRSLIALSQGCPRLRSLILYASGKFTDTGFSSLRKCTQLVELDLCGSIITDSGIQEIVGGCPAIETLNLQWCTRLTDESLKAIGTYLWGMKTLSIYGILNITPQGIHHLSALPLLASLDAYGCSGIHGFDIVKTLPSLSELII